MERYFVCHRYRQRIDDDYVQEFYSKREYSRIHATYGEAYKELREGFYDDSDYDAVYKVTDGSRFERIELCCQPTPVVVFCHQLKTK